MSDKLFNIILTIFIVGSFCVGLFSLFFLSDIFADNNDYVLQEEYNELKKQYTELIDTLRERDKHIKILQKQLIQCR